MAETEQVRIEKPVTLEALQALADAGYPSEVHMLIQKAEKPVMVADGVPMVVKAMRLQGERYQTEADKLKELVNLSDDPMWKTLVGDKYDEMQKMATDSFTEADNRESALSGLMND